jgi:hypothetical protein
MGDIRDDLPPEILAKFMSYLGKVEGEIRVTDPEGFMDFVFEYRDRYPVLQEFLTVDWDAVNEHYQRTGKVPSGIRLIKTETREGDNVTKLEIIDGSD